MIRYDSEVDLVVAIAIAIMVVVVQVVAVAMQLIVGLTVLNNCEFAMRCFSSKKPHSSLRAWYAFPCLVGGAPC